jgi:hypothetical protein
MSVTYNNPLRNAPGSRVPRTRAERLESILLLPEKTAIEEYGLKPDRFTGILGTLRKQFTSEGQEYKRMRERYKKAPHIHLPKAERSETVENMMRAWRRLEDKRVLNGLTYEESEEQKRLAEIISTPRYLEAELRPKISHNAISLFGYDIAKTSRGDDVMFAPFTPTGEYNMKHPRHASGLIRRQNDTTEFFNPWGTPTTFLTPLNYQDALSDYPGVFHSPHEVQVDLPVCNPITQHRLLKSTESAEEHYRKLEEAATRLGVHKEIIPSLINESMRLDVEAGIPYRRSYIAQEEYKKGGIVHNPSFKFSHGRKSNDDIQMRHQITAVPLVEKKKLGMDGKGQMPEKKPRMKKGGLVEKVKKVARKAKEVAETVGRAVVKEAKKHSHHLIEAGKKAGAVAGTALGTAAVETVGPMGVPAGKYVGEKAGEFIGRKIHEKIQSLKKGGKVKKGEQLLQVSDTAPVKTARKARAKKEPVKEAPAKKSSAWMDHVKAYRAAHGGSYKDAMKAAKATYKK